MTSTTKSKSNLHWCRQELNRLIIEGKGDSKYADILRAKIPNLRDSYKRANQ